MLIKVSFLGLTVQVVVAKNMNDGPCGGVGRACGRGGVC